MSDTPSGDEGDGPTRASLFYSTPSLQKVARTRRGVALRPRIDAVVFTILFGGFFFYVFSFLFVSFVAESTGLAPDHAPYPWLAAPVTVVLVWVAWRLMLRSAADMEVDLEERVVRVRTRSESVAFPLQELAVVQVAHYEFTPRERRWSDSNGNYEVILVRERAGEKRERYCVLKVEMGGEARVMAERIAAAANVELVDLADDDHPPGRPPAS